jgi:hypothetical protein
MSTLYPTIEIEYHKRKPSKAVIMRTLGEYLKQGGKSFTISWGENQIDIDYHPGQEQWYGGGHIKNISGWDIAIELNEIRKQAIKETNQFIKDHFQFIHVGG